MPLAAEPGAEMGRPRVVVIGASAGGVETLLRVVSGLPSDLAASVCIVLHLAPGAASALPAILQRRSRLPCRAAVDGEPLRAGEILVAPPDRHLTVEDGHVALTLGPRENGHRPSVDTLFRTAAAAQEGRVIGVVLSGTRDDGTVGLGVIKAAGGTALVQDPAEAIYPGMPASALGAVDVDVVATSERMAAAIIEAVNHPPRRPGGAANPGPPGNPGHHERPQPEDDPREPVPSADPGLFEATLAANGGAPASTCQQGVEAALWAAIRALEDRAALLDRLGRQAQERGFCRSAQTFFERAREAAAQAGVIRTTLGQATAATLQAVADSEEVEADQRRLG